MNSMSDNLLKWVYILLIFTCSEHILPICLPSEHKTFRLNGRKALIAGWGKTHSNMGHSGTNMLQVATVPILSKLN